MASQDRHVTLTADDVAKKTYLGLMSLCRQLGIPSPEGSLEEVRQAVINHIHTQGQQPERLNLWETVEIDSSVDTSNRRHLHQFFETATQFVKQLPGAFKDDLNDMFPDYLNRLKTSMAELESSQRIILVAGEMASGKSSLINLLLGSPILPTSNLQCTATIVEVSYGELPRAEMHFRKKKSTGSDAQNSRPRPIEIKEDRMPVSQGFTSELDKHITETDPYTDESPYEKIKLFWPSDMLKGGLTIVDSPGVGDSRNTFDQLAQYMESALGFIYVIDSTSIINKHRLGQLLLKAMEVSGDHFDPDTALFVCNRWDMVPPEDGSKVKASLQDRLSMVVREIRQSQMYTISTKQSLVKLDYGHVSEDHRRLVQGIQRFLPKTLKGKLKVYYRYLSSLVKRCLYSLRISYYYTTRSLEQKHMEVEHRSARLKTLKDGGEKKLEDMRREVKKLAVDAADQIHQHLQSPERRAHLTTWQEGEYAMKPKWRDSMKAAIVAVSERISEEVNLWGKASHFENRVANDIVNKFEKTYDMLSSEVKEVQTIFLPNEDKIMVFDLHNSMRAKKKRPDSDGLLSMGAAVAGSLDLESKEVDVKKLFKEHFDKDPRQVMTALTAMGLQSLTSITLLTALTKYFNRFVKGIDEVGKRVPNMLKADQQLLQQMTKDMAAQESGLRHYPRLSNMCQEVQGNLDMFYLHSLMDSDFTPDQLSFDREDILGRGTFATVYKATLKKGPTQSEVVALKEPRNFISNKDVTDLLLEEAMLREVDHENLIKYYGMFQSRDSKGRIKLNMVMVYCPFTLKELFIHKTKDAPAMHGGNPRKQRECLERMTDVLVQIIKGLGYLHEMGIVHRDLKPDNVLLTESNVVKIADLGLAKRVKDVATQKIGTPVYIAPEVLLMGGKYNTKADIYSFGMITWELWYGIDLAGYASEELPYDLEKSIRKGWRPSLELATAPSEFWRKLIDVCWDQLPKNRPKTHDIEPQLLKVLEQLKMLKHKLQDV